MTVTTPPRSSATLAAERRDRLMASACEAILPQGSRPPDKGGRPITSRATAVCPVHA